MKHLTAHPHRNAAILGIVTVAFLAIGADVVLPGHSHVPIVIGFLVVAAYLALHDRIHSVWITHHRVPSRIPPRSSLPNHGAMHSARRKSRPSHLRDDRPGWM